MKNYIILFFALLTSPLFAQEKMEVIRCEAVDRSSPVTNIYIDEAEQIWVGNYKGLNRVYAPDNGELVNKPASEWSLLQTHDGNSDIRIPLNDLITQMGTDGQAIASKEDRITAAIYDSSKGDLWVGTAQSGLFQFEIEPGLRLVKQHHSGNSKLYSDKINTLFIDRSGRLWIGTDGGACFGRYGKWQLQERYFNITAFAQNSKGEIWVMGDDLLWQVDARSRWNPIDIEDARIVEGAVADIAFDKEDDLWIASEIVAEYNTETEESRIFGPAQEFTSQDVFSINVDSKNVVWIGTNDKGLYIIQKAATLYVSAEVEKYLTCNSDAKDASVKVLVDGGDAPYTYTWTNGASGENPSNLGAGEYSLTVTDKRGKSGRAKVTIPDPNMNVSVNVDKSVSADQSADGAATIEIKGGQPEYSIRWASGETTASATQLEPGAQTVKVTDKAGCSAEASFTLEKEVGALSLNISQTAEIKCAGEKTAALKVENGGGKEPYTYQWSASGLSGEAPENIPAGQYSVTMTDAIGQTAVANITVNEPDGLAVEIKIDAPASTNNSDGKATASAKGGDGNYSFSWSNGENSAQASGLAPSSHSVTVTDGNGCSATANVNISEDILPLSVSIKQTQTIQCAGTATATLQATPNGGKPNYTYSWTGGIQGQAPTSLKPGKYDLTITDAAGTTATSDFEIKEPKPLTIAAKAEAAASTGNADGKASAKGNGGTGDLRFSWSSGASGKTAENLAPGSYVVTVTDANQCTSTASVEILENILPLSVSISPQSEVKCEGGNSGALTAETNGGKGPFEFAWSGQNAGAISANGNQANQLGAGAYSVIVTDATGATASSDFTLDTPKSISLTAKADAPASTGNSDGKASVKASGGAGDFKFAWSSGASGKSVSNLAPGAYEVTATDANGCTSTANVEISENILPLSVSISPQSEVKCEGGNSGALTAETIGGKGPFEFAWSGQTPDAFDANGQQATNLGAGAYAVTVTDATGATASSDFNLDAPKAISVSVKADAPASTGNADGKASVKANGGTGDFKFTWSNGASGKSVSNLAPGAYEVTATDANGCTSTASVEISENILPLSVSISLTQNIACAGEATATLQAESNGGKPNFTYAWTGGLQGQAPTSLKPGKYALTITDAEGTTATADYEIKEPTPLTISAKADAPASTGNADGKASAKASGGTGNLTFAWSNGQSGKSTSELAPGNYEVTVTDANGCTATSSVEISENILPLTASISQTQNIKCAGEVTATLQAEPNGGKPAYTYAWSGGLQGQAPTGLAPGDYDLTVTDALGTTATSKFSIKEPKPINVELIKNRPATTNETKNGKATLRASGGTGDFNFKWDNGESLAEVTNLGAGIHEVTVTDGNGCEEIVKIETKTRINPELEAGRLRAGQLVKLDKIYFPPDSSRLEPESIPTLDELFEFMTDNTGITIEVGGHTNGIPSHEFCDNLSKERAKSVAQYLVDKGLSANRLTYKGYGKRKPIATNKTADGRAKNQRVEIKIVKLE